MRLSFPNGEHTDVVVKTGTVSLGSAGDNTVILPVAGVAAEHVRITDDQRGIVLHVASPGARVHVNARPVREKAILRMGDILSMDSVTVLLKADNDDAIETLLPPSINDVRTSDKDSTLFLRTVLRGMSGTYFGKTIPITGRFVIGRGNECDLMLDESDMPQCHAIIENLNDRIYLRDLDSLGGACVNGVSVKDAVLHSGDQIVFERNRFLLEAPGFPIRGQLRVTPITKTLPPSELLEPAVVIPARGSIWWLIAVAALIGFSIAALLLGGG